MRDACRGANIPFALWLTRNFTPAEFRQAIDAIQPDGAIAEGEVPAQHPDGTPNPQAVDWNAMVQATADLNIDLAVATSWTPFQKFIPQNGQMVNVPAPELARPLIRNGWKVMPYVYPAEHAGITVSAAKQYAKHYTHEAAPAILDDGEGWYWPEPVLGCYGGYTLNSAAFVGKETCAGFSIWDAGEIF